MEIRDITEGEKKFLNAIGKYPDVSVGELLNYTTYKRESTVWRKLNQFKEQRIVRGPFWEVDYSKLCKNPLHLLLCILELNQSYTTVISHLKRIESLKVIYPVLSPHKEVLAVLFLSSHDEELKALFQLLKDSDIVTDYITHVYDSKRMMETPNFFGDVNPSLDNLLDPCNIPDMSLKHHGTNWNECDIAVLPYLEGGYKNGKLIEILKTERKLNRTWKYQQIKYSREKMLKNGLIEKNYMIFPFPYDQCVDFILFFKPETGDKDLMQRILYNFGRGGRLYRDYVLCEDWGSIGFICHPQFLTSLMNKLDRIKEIREKKVYQIRSVPPKKYIFVQIPSLKYFDIDKQTLEYPYHVYKEKIKERLKSK